MEDQPIKSITSVDPGFKNMAIYKYNVEKDTGIGWAWVDLCGKKLSTPTAKEIKQKLLSLFYEMGWLFESDIILVEKQNKMSGKCHKIEKTFKKHFKGKCIVVCPKKTKKGVLKRIKATKEDSGVKKKKWEFSSRSQHQYSEVMKYLEKKNAAIGLGKIMLNGAERKMVSKIQLARKEWAKTILVYDKKMIQSKRTKRKTPRKIKTRPDDLFDAAIIAIQYASDITETNLFHKRLHFTPSMNQNQQRDKVQMIDLTVQE